MHDLAFRFPFQLLIRALIETIITPNTSYLRITESRCTRRNAMKPALMLLLLSFFCAGPIFAQDHANDPQASAPGCGPANAKFEVKSEGSNHPVAQPDPGKAVIYFLQNDDHFYSRPRPTNKWGLDGNWVGATQANAYFFVTVDPGEHHLCTEWQNFVGPFAGHQAAALHLTAQPGGVYYFRVRDLYRKDIDPPSAKLEPVDSDEALLLMSKYALSIFEQKK